MNPFPTDIEETFEFNFVGDGIPDVPKRYQYINQPTENKPFHTTLIITNSVICVSRLSTDP